MEELNKLPLWSDGKSDDDINCQAENDSEAVIYHLLEDIKCLKEDNKKLIGDYNKCAAQFGMPLAT